MSDGADADECLGGPALIHGLVAFSHVVEADFVVEDPARVDVPGYDIAEQLRDVAADRRDAAAQPDVPEDAPTATPQSHGPSSSAEPPRDWPPGSPRRPPSAVPRQEPTPVAASGVGHDCLVPTMDCHADEPDEP